MSNMNSNHLRQDTAARRRAAEDRHLPYPRWATILTRGVACIVEVDPVAYTAWLLARWSDDGGFRIRRGDYEKILGASAIALFFNLAAVILSLLRRYAWGWVLVMMGDIAVAALGLAGAISVSALNNPGFDPQRLGWVWVEAGHRALTLGLVVSIFHALAALGAYAGCCLVGCYRGDDDDEDEED